MTPKFVPGVSGAVPKTNMEPSAATNAPFATLLRVAGSQANVA